MALIQQKAGLIMKRAGLSDAAVQEEDYSKFGSARTGRVDKNFSLPSTQSPRDSSSNKQTSNAYTSERSSTDTASMSPPSSKPTNPNPRSKEDQLESTRAEMGEVMEENERLKSLLAQILKDYDSLQSQLVKTMQSKGHDNKAKAMIDPNDQQQEQDTSMEDEEEEETEEEAEKLVSLSLGMTAPTGRGKKGSTNKTVPYTNVGGLSLGLDCGFGTTSVTVGSNLSLGDSSDHDRKDDEVDRPAPWTPNKILKTSHERTPTSSGVAAVANDEVSQHVHVKKARVSVRAKCDAPTMNDGCQWRKYGQKISKGNPCPRAYYRCTVAPACPVRKQVQRCAEDMSILITTYEGTHNHPLPMAATAMASTTSAAAKMLISGSSTAAIRPTMAAPLAAMSSTTSTATTLNGLSFNISDQAGASGSIGPFKPQYFFPPNPAITTSPHYPTITLDLTSPSATTPMRPPPQQQHLMNRLALPSTDHRIASSTSSTGGFNFSSTTSVGTVPPWNNTYNGSINRRPFEGIGKQEQVFYNNQPTYSYLQRNANTNTNTNMDTTVGNNNALTDTIAKAITTDPSFQSALAAAISSIVAKGGQAAAATVAAAGGGTFDSATTAANVISSSQNSQSQRGALGATGSLSFLQPALGLLRNQTNKSGSNLENREHMNGNCN